MKENEKAARQCVKNYFIEDKVVMIDESIMRIRGIMFYIYDLIFFGNKIIITKEMIERIEKRRIGTSFRMLAKNASFLLEHIKNDKYGNYEIIDISSYGANYIERIANYLKENTDIVYLLENKKLYNGLMRYGINEEHLKLLETTMKVESISQNGHVRFETLGIIRCEEERMVISKHQDNSIVKIYNFSGKEKEGNDIEVNDIILIRYDKNIKSCYNLYWIVSRHTKHQAIRIIWTDVQKGHKTNFYVERLEEKYRKIIKENIPT